MGPNTQDRRHVRILQTSDVHLGPRMREPDGLLHRDECVCPIHVLGHLVDEHDVDVVLIVGDLFEHARVSHQLVEETFAELAHIDADVVLLPGNHDVHDDTAVYRRQRATVDASGISLPRRPARRDRRRRRRRPARLGASDGGPRPALPAARERGAPPG